jgi:hypothetical protein
VTAETLIASGGGRRTAVLETMPAGGESPQTEAGPLVSQTAGHEALAAA